MPLVPWAWVAVIRAVHLSGVADGLHLFIGHLLGTTVVPRLMTPPVAMNLMQSAPCLMFMRTHFSVHQGRRLQRRAEWIRRYRGYSGCPTMAAGGTDGEPGAMIRGPHFASLC